MIAMICKRLLITVYLFFLFVSSYAQEAYKVTTNYNRPGFSATIGVTAAGL